MTRWGLLLLPLLDVSAASAAEMTVGGPEAAHPTVAAALAAAGDGDVITIAAGLYDEAGLETRAPNVTLRAASDAVGDVILTNDGRVLRVRHPGVTVDGLVLDAQHGDGDALQIRTEASGFALRNAQVRNAGRDCIDMGGPSDVLIEDTEVHHCLAATAPDCTAAECRQDAHAIVHGPAQRVTLRNVVAHTFSGDAWQADPGRDAPGWTDVVIEGCTFWTAPLEAPVGGFGAGINPAENAVDTKVWAGADTPEAAARLTIRDTTAYGFRGGVIGNMAAFNIKENVRALVDGVTVYDSEIAFRLRCETGSRAVGAQVTLRNIVVEDVDVAVRFEDDIRPITIEHATFGRDIGEVFKAASVPRPSAEVLRCFNSLSVTNVAQCQMSSGAMLLGGAEGGDDPGDAWFDEDYRLVAGSPAIDVGEELAHVATDRLGAARRAGAGWDLGAFEFGAGPAGDPADDPDLDPDPDPDPDPGTDPDADPDGGADGSPDADPDPAAGPGPGGGPGAGGGSDGDAGGARSGGGCGLGGGVGGAVGGLIRLWGRRG